MTGAFDLQVLRFTRRCAPGYGRRRLPWRGTVPGPAATCARHLRIILRAKARGATKPMLEQRTRHRFRLDVSVRRTINQESFMAIPRSSTSTLISTSPIENEGGAIPSTMLAAVYRGVDDVRMEEVPVPEIGAGEILIRVHTCGICGTDLKKIATGSHSAPRIFGHETSGIIARVGEGVGKFSVGDRVVVFHHIPCGECYYCQHKTFAQCPTYKKVGCTAGFEPSGGGFAEYVRVMDWIVEKGTVRIPDGISFEQACFVEPVNTCMKGIEALRLNRGETVLVIGQGPIGIILSALAQRAGATVITSDLHP